MTKIMRFLSFLIADREISDRPRKVNRLPEKKFGGLFLFRWERGIIRV
jgi:hypothetical protein